MAAGILQPDDVGAVDAERVLAFVNAAADAAALADTVGFGEGAEIGRQVAAAIIERRTAEGAFESLDQLMAVTGINAARFTEIVVALSGARPGPPARTMRLMPAWTRPWLGQRVNIAGQLLDARGHGVPGATVTCLASAGLLFAPGENGEIQRGAAVRLVTEPGGLVRMELQPALAPPLDPDAQAALEAELGRLGSEADGPAAVAPALAAFASRYRAGGGALLREAVDRLFEAFPTDDENPGPAWLVEPVTVIAIADGGDGQPTLAAAATLFFRNWLGGWRAALRGAVRADTRLDEALSGINLGKASADGLIRSLIGATDAFSVLELGVVGGRERDRLGGRSVNRFLETVATQVKPEVMVNAVRAVGASNAAIAAGGFAVVNAIQNVQHATGTLAATGVAESKRNLGLLDGRLTQLEGKALDRATLDTFRVEILAQADRKVSGVDGRLTTLEGKALDRATLDTFRVEILAQTDRKVSGVDGRLTTLETQRVTRNDLATLETKLAQGFEGRFTGLEGKALDKAALDTFRAEILAQTDRKVAGVDGRLATLETQRVTRTDLSALETKLTQGFGGRLTQLEGKVLDKALLDTFRAEILAQTDGKVAGVDGRLATIEAQRVTRNDLSALETKLAQGFGGRLTQLEGKALDKATLDTFRVEILAQTDRKVAGVDGRLATIEAQRVTRTDLSALETRLTQGFGGRLTQLEGKAIDKATLDAFRAETLAQADRRMSGVDGRIAALEGQRLTAADLNALETRLETRLTQRFSTDIGKAVKDLGTRVDGSIVRTRDELTVRIDAKADQTAVRGLSQSFQSLEAENRRVVTRLEGVDTQMRTLGGTVRKP